MLRTSDPAGGALPLQTSPRYLEREERELAMAGIEAVVFDIGNVLLRWDPHGFYDRVIGAERRRALWGAVDLEAMNLRSDAGEDIADLVAETAAAHPAHAGDIRRWHDDWLQMAGLSLIHI